MQKAKENKKEERKKERGQWAGEGGKLRHTRLEKFTNVTFRAHLSPVFT